MGNFKESEKKQVIIATTWEYLLKKGVTNASIGDLCRETNLAQSSLYYWFKNKEDIWITAGKYGLSKVVFNLFDFTLKHKGLPKQYFETLLQEIDKYKDELRCVIQITLNPVFGERMRNSMKEFNNQYADYAKELVEIFCCTFEQAELFIYSTLSAVIDYVVWDDGEKTQMLLDNLYKRVLRNINI